MHPTNFEDAVIPAFSLPKPLVYYLMTNSNHFVFKKLSKSCKYIFQKFPFAIVETAHMLNGMFDNEKRIVQIDGNSFFSDDYTKRLKSKIWIIGELMYFEPQPKILSKIVKSDLRILFSGCKLTFNEFYILAKSGTLELLGLYGGCVFDNSNVENFVPVEYILPLAPKAKHIVYNKCHVTKDTSKNLSLLKRQNKIGFLNIKDIDGPLDLKLMKKFVSENMIENKKLYLSFTDPRMHSMELKAFEGDVTIRQ